jgi:cytochrome d ubiquinol oxidase subunit II
VDEVEVEAAAGASSTLWALVVTFGLAALTVLPSLADLFWVSQRDEPLGQE